MLRSMNESPYNRVTIKKYIVRYYGTRQDKFSSLCFEDEDKTEDNLRTILDGLSQNLGFESKVEQLILTSERINKFEKLLQLLQENNPKFEISIVEIANPTISSPAAEAVSGSGFGAVSKTWTKQATLHSNAEPTISQQTVYENTETQVDLPQIDSFRQDIARLEKNIGLLGEVDGLLGAISQRIRDLLLDVTVKHQMLQNEQLNATKKSNTFYREQKADSLSTRPAASRSQPFSSPPSGSSWRETSFSKQN